MCVHFSVAVYVWIAALLQRPRTLRIGRYRYVLVQEQVIALFHHGFSEM